MCEMETQISLVDATNAATRLVFPAPDGAAIIYKSAENSLCNILKMGVGCEGLEALFLPSPARGRGAGGEGLEGLCVFFSSAMSINLIL